MHTAQHRILCVDDEPVNLELLGAALGSKGFDVAMALSGAEALDKIKEERFDLIILDVMMPILNGFDVCKKIKENKQFRDIPVIMLTALSSKESRLKARAAGAEDFISKPFKVKDVFDRIRTLLEQSGDTDNIDGGSFSINNLPSF